MGSSTLFFFFRSVIFFAIWLFFFFRLFFRIEFLHQFLQPVCVCSDCCCVIWFGRVVFFGCPDFAAASGLFSFSEYILLARPSLSSRFSFADTPRTGLVFILTFTTSVPSDSLTSTSVLYPLCTSRIFDRMYTIISPSDAPTLSCSRYLEVGAS